MNGYANCDATAIRKFLDGTMTHEDLESFEEHLDHCDSCCVELSQQTADSEKWQQVSGHLKGSELCVTDESSNAHKMILDVLGPTDDPDMMGRFAGYEIAGVIGIGGMGAVLKGFDRALNRFVAIKILLPTLATSGSARQRFAREARAAAAIVHDNVIAIHSVSSGNYHEAQENDPHSSLPYLVMPYLRGESLQTRLDRYGFLPITEVLRISIQIADGLAAAHDQGLVHRDIKPANILLAEQVERVTITDFGLARAVNDASLTRTGVIAGTPQYMSPEQASGDSITTRSDLFSLGSVMYRMLTGRIPFRAESPFATLRKIIDDSAEPMREINPEIPSWLCQFVSQLHQKDHELRPTNAQHVAEKMRQFLAHLQHPNENPLPSLGNQTSDRKHPSLVPALGGISMLTLFAILYFLLFPAANPVVPTPTQPTFAVQKLGEDSLTEGELKQSFRVQLSPQLERSFLDVDIKRGSIVVVGYDQKDVEVHLTVPNYSNFSKTDQDGMRTIRPNNLDFAIRETPKGLKVDGNSRNFVTNLQIRVPRNIDIKLDTYSDGEIEVSNIVGAVTARSQNNSITARDISGSFDGYSYHGDFNVTLIDLNDQLTEIETYNGDIALQLPTGIDRTVKYRTGRGLVTTNYSIEIPGEAVIETGNSKNIKFSNFNSGKIGAGGPLLALETENGNISIKKLVPPAEKNDSKKQESAGKNGSTELTAVLELIDERRNTFEEIQSYVKDDKMPAYVMHAAKAAWLESQRERAILDLELSEADSLEAQLILTYERAIKSYNEMLDDPEWKKRYPDMNIDEVKPYQAKLEFYRRELRKRN